MRECFNVYLAKYIEALKSKGSAEDVLATEGLNMRKYARCEWKCIAFIGTDDWGKFHNEAAMLYGRTAIRPNDQNQFQ